MATYPPTTALQRTLSSCQSSYGFCRPVCPDPLADTTEVRTALRDVLRSTQWLCKLTFRENDYQQVLELDCKHLEPFQKKIWPASCRFCHDVLSARAALLHLWMCSTWTTNWGYFAQGNWMLRRLECSLPSTTSSSPTRKLFSKIHSRPRPCK